MWGTGCHVKPNASSSSKSSATAITLAQLWSPKVAMLVPFFTEEQSRLRNKLPGVIVLAAHRTKKLEFHLGPTGFPEHKWEPLARQIKTTETLTRLHMAKW